MIFDHKIQNELSQIENDLSVNYRQTRIYHLIGLIFESFQNDFKFNTWFIWYISTPRGIHEYIKMQTDGKEEKFCMEGFLKSDQCFLLTVRSAQHT